MKIKGLLIGNRQGQIRFSRYFEPIDQVFGKSNIQHVQSAEAELCRKCASHSKNENFVLEYDETHIVYRPFGVLFFICLYEGSSEEGGCENELALHEFLYVFVKVLDTYFNKVCELDIMYNLGKIHIVLEELVGPSGCIQISPEESILRLLRVLEN